MDTDIKYEIVAKRETGLIGALGGGWWQVNKVTKSRPTGYYVDSGYALTGMSLKRKPRRVINKLFKEAAAEERTVKYEYPRPSA